MKIAYLLSWELAKLDGVTKKVFAQTREWIKNGHQVSVFCISTTQFENKYDVPVVLVLRKKRNNIFGELASVKKAYKEVSRQLDHYNPDIIYHRSEVYQSVLSEVMGKYPTVVEMNSNDLSEIKQISKISLKGKIRYQYYKRIRDRYLSKAAGFCCVTHEIANLPSIKKFKRPVEVIPNTIVPERYAITFEESSSTVPKLFFMGSPDQDWHGVDKMIALAEAAKGKLEIDVVGPSKPLGPVPDNIRFHGYLHQQEYEKILAGCDIGICTMALHRKGMYEASPLKTREYLAYGLPIIIGYTDTAFIDHKPDWVLQLENVESNVSHNVAKIIAFATAYKGRKLSVAEVEKYIDVRFYEHKRVAFMENIQRNTLIAQDAYLNQ